MLKMKILGEVVRESGKTTGCIVADLNALDCKKGCMVCLLEEMTEQMIMGFPNIREGPSKCKNRIDQEKQSHLFSKS